MNLPTYTCILFDLDGTLTDPFEGISNSINYALQRLGRAPISLTTLRTWIGPSLRGSFASVLDGDHDLVEQAVVFYRERYGPIGSTENRLYPGIPGLLADLDAAGCAVCLATSKPQVFAHHILEHFHLDHHFRVIGGASLDTSRERKADVIAYVLEQLPPQYRERVVMVGDREHDVEGAKEHGIPAIGVTWGYGSAEELRAAGAIVVVDDVAALRPLLGV